MALVGNLQDFNITNILPIIKAENQTGVLEVKYKDDVIKITFLEGQVVYGETTQAKDGRRLRNTLVFNRMMSGDGWKQLQSQHTDALDSIWNVLASMVPPETASKLLRRQVLDSIFALMRFQKGDYNFVSQKKVEYPEKLVQPMDVDFLLMEGARVSDEWEMMEKRLPSLNAILRKAIAVEQSVDDSQKLQVSNEVADYAETLEFELLKERGIELTEGEKKVLSVVGQYKSVRDLMDGADLSYLDAGSSLVSLLKKKILVPMTHKQVAGAMRPHKVKKSPVGFLALLLTIALLGAAGYLRFLYPPYVTGVKTFVAEQFKKSTVSDMESIKYSLQIFHMQNGRLPTNLGELEASGLADDGRLTDRWGREFQYERKANSFVLYSLGPDQYEKGDEIYLPKK